MTLRLVQLVDRHGARVVAALQDEGPARAVVGAAFVYELAQAALVSGDGLVRTVEAVGLGDVLDIEAALDEGRVLPPIDHPDPAHLMVSGTGLTHLGSAKGRDAMHAAAAAADAQTDSMRMFLKGVEGGRPERGRAGAQPEWFYKGDGSCLTGSHQPLAAPAFALDGGEEPEIAGIYLIAPDGRPWRLGYALGNEFSDHVTERENYLWLAHSKLRRAALGAELLTGDLPAHVAGTSRLLRDGETLWEAPFLTGEENMCHSLANLEHHHFKYAGFRRPGDVHVHFFGTATLSYSAGVRARAGDVFEIAAAPYRHPLRNRLAQASDDGVQAVDVL
jgi:hypothetical protein